MTRAALFLAGRAFVKYRREGGTRTNVLADFFISAHAAVLGCGILTRDARRYRNYFPRVALVDPEGSAAQCATTKPTGQTRNRSFDADQCWRTLVLLLMGGDKRTQTADIKTAREYLAELLRRNHENQSRQNSGNAQRGNQAQQRSGHHARRRKQ